MLILFIIFAVIMLIGYFVEGYTKADNMFKANELMRDEIKRRKNNQ